MGGKKNLFLDNYISVTYWTGAGFVYVTIISDHLSTIMVMDLDCSLLLYILCIVSKGLLKVNTSK